MTAPQDDDEAFRQIVAGFGRESTDPVPRWPVEEDLGPERLPTEPEQPRDTPPAPEEALPGWLEPAALEDTGHFVPPPPPRLPRPRVRTAGGLLLVLAGFAALFVPFRIGLDDSAASLVLGIVVLSGGVALLLSTMRDAPGSNDRPDDGAVL